MAILAKVSFFANEPPLVYWLARPTHIWLAGKFIDLGDVSEITVDARVVFSTRRT